MSKVPLFIRKLGFYQHSRVTASTIRNETSDFVICAQIEEENMICMGLLSFETNRKLDESQLHLAIFKSKGQLGALDKPFTRFPAIC